MLCHLAPSNKDRLSFRFRPRDDVRENLFAETIISYHSQATTLNLKESLPSQIVIACTGIALVTSEYLCGELDMIYLCCIPFSSYIKPQNRYPNAKHLFNPA